MLSRLPSLLPVGEITMISTTNRGIKDDSFQEYEHYSGDNDILTNSILNVNV